MEVDFGVSNEPSNRSTFGGMSEKPSPQKRKNPEVPLAPPPSFATPDRPTQVHFRSNNAPILKTAKLPALKLPKIATIPLKLPRTGLPTSAAVREPVQRKEAQAALKDAPALSVAQTTLREASALPIALPSLDPKPAVPQEIGTSPKREDPLPSQPIPTPASGPETTFQDWIQRSERCEESLLQLDADIQVQKHRLSDLLLNMLVLNNDVLTVQASPLHEAIATMNKEVQQFLEQREVEE